MKRHFLIVAAAGTAMALAFCLTPALVKTEATVAVTVWELARPPRQVDSGFYFRKAQWLADLRTLRAGLRFIWETGRGGPAQNGVPPLAAPGRAQLLTHTDGSSNNLAIPSASPGDPT